jgi:hypothetical protein
VNLAATIFQMQPVMNAMFQAQTIRGKSIVDHRNINPDRISGCGAAGPGNGDHEPVQKAISPHCFIPQLDASKRSAITSKERHRREIATCQSR